MSGPIRADKVKALPVDWLWRERVPRRMMTIFAGQPDQGKGLIMAHLAAEVSRMKIQREDGTYRWGRVLYSAIEDSHELMTAPRLQAAEANMKNVHLWRFRLGGPHDDFEELEYILQGEEIDLLVMDPLAAHLSGGVSRHSDNIREVLSPLARLIEETGTATVMVEHVLKHVSPYAHPLKAIGGSGSGLAAAARMAFLFGVDPSDEDRRILANIKSNIREPPDAIAFELDQADVAQVGAVPFLIYGDEIDFDPRKLITVQRHGKAGRPPDKRAAAAEWLTNYLWLMCDCKPTAVGKIEEDAKQWGMSSKTLRRAATDLHVEKVPPGGGPKVTWQLPDAFIKRLNESNGESSGIDQKVAPKPRAKRAAKPAAKPAKPPAKQVGSTDTSDLDDALAELLKGKDGDD